MRKVTPWLWFDTQSEEAATFYTSVFANSHITGVYRFGVSWQIVPTRLHELLTDPDPRRAERAMRAMFEMKKIDIAALERAAVAAPS